MIRSVAVTLKLILVITFTFTFKGSHRFNLFGYSKDRLLTEQIKGGNSTYDRPILPVLFLRGLR